jgi:hypothetical protein
MGTHVVGLRVEDNRGSTRNLIALIGDVLMGRLDETPFLPFILQ